MFRFLMVVGSIYLAVQNPAVRATVKNCLRSAADYLEDKEREDNSIVMKS